MDKFNLCLQPFVPKPDILLSELKSTLRQLLPTLVTLEQVDDSISELTEAIGDSFSEGRSSSDS